jgi:hypothetical protein
VSLTIIRSSGMPARCSHWHKTLPNNKRDFHSRAAAMTVKNLIPAFSPSEQL